LIRMTENTRTHYTVQVFKETSRYFGGYVNVKVIWVSVLGRTAN
jgi:hypothetical protein